MKGLQIVKKAADKKKEKAEELALTLLYSGVCIEVSALSADVIKAMQGA